MGASDSTQSRAEFSSYFAIYPITDMHDITGFLPISGHFPRYLTPTLISALARPMSSSGLDCSRLSLAYLWLSLSVSSSQAAWIPPAQHLSELCLYDHQVFSCVWGKGRMGWFAVLKDPIPPHDKMRVTAICDIDHVSFTSSLHSL